MTTPSRASRTASIVEICWVALITAIMLVAFFVMPNCGGYPDTGLDEREPCPRCVEPASTEEGEA